MKQLRFIFFLYLLRAFAVSAEPVAVPNTFSAGTPAKASEVNANFTALANAVNLVPRPLMVYDGTGKLIGQFNTENSGVLISIFGAPFEIISVTKITFGYGIFFYASNDCSGEAYVPVNSNYLVPIAQVSGTNAYIPADNGVSLSVYSQRAFNNGVLDSCYSSFAGNILVSPVTGGRVVDLSIFTPPFSVH